MSYDWKTIVGTIAPTVAAVLGGPLAGLAVESLGKALGLEAPTVQKVQDALTKGQLSGDQIAQIQQAELVLKARMKELDITEEQLYVSDRDSARKREATVQDKTNRNLAYLVVASFICLVASTLLGYSHVESALAGTLVGYLSAKAEQVMAYYFGSSRSSDRKTELLSQAPAVEK